MRSAAHGAAGGGGRVGGDGGGRLGREVVESPPDSLPPFLPSDAWPEEAPLGPTGPLPLASALRSRPTQKSLLVALPADLPFASTVPTAPGSILSVADTQETSVTA